MTLNERLQTALTSAIRARDEPRRDALRLAIAAVYGAQKTARRPLGDDEVVAVLARELRMRRESIEAFRRGRREDLVEREEAAAAVLAEFLPEPLDEADLGELVRAAIAETGASSPRDLGRVMGVLASRIRGRAEGRAVSQMVARELGDLG